ncbi:MAG: hypothetical protein ACI9S8_002241 [Chlamydiales bacterium]|jgi:hypothetical protein
MTVIVKTQKTDEIRRLISLAIQDGRNRQSSETGFVHFNYKDKADINEHSIPVLENVLFALALLRSRMSDNVLESKEILEKILYFQHIGSSPMEGNFPLYLHEFPTCKHRWLAVQLIPPFFWIYKEFRNILGNSLRTRIEECLRLLISYSLQMHKENPAPYHFAVILAAGTRAVGETLNVPKWRNDDSVEKLAEPKSRDLWFSPRKMGEILTGLQMCYTELSGTPWETFLHHLTSTWDPQTQTYIGPPVQEYYWKSGLEPSYYDFFLSCQAKGELKEYSPGNIVTLKGALIRSFSEELPSQLETLSMQGSLNGRAWEMTKEKNFSYSVQEHDGLPQSDEGYHVFRMAWGSSAKVYNLVCPKGNYKMSFEKHENGADLFFTLPEDIDLNNKKHCREIAFYCDLCENINLRVKGKAATTFQLNEDVLVNSEKAQLTLRFAKVEGDGRFFGHITKGDRPAQLYLKREKSLSVFDTLILLRTVHRSGSCCIKVEIRFDAR